MCFGAQSVLEVELLWSQLDRREKELNMSKIGARSVPCIVLYVCTTRLLIPATRTVFSFFVLGSRFLWLFVLVWHDVVFIFATLLFCGCFSLCDVACMGV